MNRRPPTRCNAVMAGVGKPSFSPNSRTVPSARETRIKPSPVPSQRTSVSASMADIEFFSFIGKPTSWVLLASRSYDCKVVPQAIKTIRFQSLTVVTPLNPPPSGKAESCATDWARVAMLVTSFILAAQAASLAAACAAELVFAGIEAGWPWVTISRFPKWSGSNVSLPDLKSASQFLALVA